MPKKIILTVTNDLVYDQRMQRICGSLQENGYSVELIGRAFKDSKKITRYKFAQRRLKCFFKKGIAFYAEFNLRLFLFLLINNFDIVCGCDLDTLPAAVLAAKIKGKKVVYDAHEYFPESPELIGRTFKQNIWFLIERLFIGKADKIYTVSGSIAKLFNKKYKVECEVIRSLPLKQEKAIKQSQLDYILYQGAVNLGRGLNEMLLAMLKVDEMPFYIAGDGDEMEYIKKSIKKLKLDKKVKLLGKQTPEELKRITQNAYMGINLLENRGLSYYYSLSNKTFDYIQAGIPQVVIGFPEYITLNKKYNFGIVVEELSVEKIEMAIKKLIKDKTLYTQLQQNCLDAAKELCWEKEEQKLIQIYNSIT
ncbi:MAG: glycosyl transferase group 1 [Bacteroidota bacterium]|nr:glycosyl transferase group 1 [Bacteroidota bacterium]